MAATQRQDSGSAARARRRAAAATAPQPSSTGPGLPGGPFTLPADLADFTGRVEEARRIRAALAPRDRSAAPVVVLSGPGGVGKTALAAHAAHAVSDAYPDARLAVDLRGGTPRPLDPAHACAQILRGLGVPAAAIPADPGGVAALYRELTERRRALILLDDAADSAQVRPLLPAGTGCAVLVTGRRPLLALAGTVSVELDGLETDDALTLFGRIVGGPRAHPESPYAAGVVEACGHLPLAIRIAAARLSSRPRWSVESLADRLHRRRTGLAGEGREDVAVEASIAVSYECLDAAHARALRLLALPDVTQVPEEAGAALLGLPEPECADILRVLHGLGLAQSPSAGHYRCHDLVRRYVTERATAPAAELTAAMMRLLDHYLAAIPAGRPLAVAKPVAGEPVADEPPAEPSLRGA